MRCLLLLAALTSTFLMPAGLRAADPPIVFQTQPVGRILADARATIQIIGGPEAVKGFNDTLTRNFGEKGFDGLDLTRPVVGYGMVPAELADSVVVVAIPVTGEKEFLDLCERINGNAPVPLKGGLYELPSVDSTVKTLCRVANQHAYIAIGKDPTAALEPAALIPAQKLFDPTERSLASAKVHFDRLTPGTQDKLLALIAELQKGDFLGLGRIGMQEKLILNSLGKGLSNVVVQSKEAKLAVLRLGLDVPTSNFSVEIAVTPNADSSLAKVIAARKPTENKFGALITPDTAVGFKTRLPLFNDDLRDSAKTGLEEFRKEIPGGSPSMNAALDELFKGLARTVKTGEVDIVGVVRGPDKQGYFTAIGVVAFDDALPLEKAFRKFIEAEAPDEFKKHLKWDAEKAGTVNIHTLAMVEDDFIFREIKKPFGDNPTIAFAFAPNGIFVAAGPEAIDAIKKALVVKPAPSPVLEVMINPARLGKLAGTIEVEGQNMIVRSFGTEDKPFSAMSMTVEGGAELKTRFVINLKLLDRIGLVGAGSAKPAVAKEPGR